MIVAATYENGMVFQHFGRTEQFKIYTVEDSAVKESSVIGTEGKGHGELVGFLQERGVNVLICGGLGGGAKSALANAGIKVYAGNTGSADDAVKSFAEGKLAFNPDVECDHHHGEGHEHNCHSGKC